MKSKTYHLDGKTINTLLRAYMKPLSDLGYSNWRYHDGTVGIVNFLTEEIVWSGDDHEDGSKALQKLIIDKLDMSISLSDARKLFALFTGLNAVFVK